MMQKNICIDTELNALGICLEKVNSLSENEKAYFGEVLNSLKVFHKDSSNIKTVAELELHIQTIKGIHSMLKQNKKFKLDLSKFENYYDKFIAVPLFMLKMPELFTADMPVVSETGVFKIKDGLNILKGHLPMLELQILGAITEYIQKIILNSKRGA